MGPEPTCLPMATSIEWTKGYTCQTQTGQSGALPQEFQIETQGLLFTDAKLSVCKNYARFPSSATSF